jgi:hypothetical protein
MNGCIKPGVSLQLSLKREENSDTTGMNLEVIKLGKAS